MSAKKFTPKHHNSTTSIKPGTLILHSYARYVSGVVVAQATACGGRVAGYTVRTATGAHDFIPVDDAVILEVV